MRTRLLGHVDKLLLRKRAIIESVNDHLKNVCQIEHTRHRNRPEKDLTPPSLSVTLLVTNGN